MSLMSSFKLPCGTKNNYPEKLDYLTRKGKVVIFQSPSSKVKTAYIVSPKHKGVEFIVEGSPLNIDALYESIDLEEHEIRDASGVFFYKLAETREDFDHAFEKFVKAAE
ncbi:hypothetical protein HQN90_15810 [Paenibacillus alba]|uniref:hypothetical protein n=1 Tax=Paenibacillus alba TaxID=1197127 RepID=UPI0015644D4A|nr:hypothetical protein [Paenibacillus alba]NQX67588.1 hypothetical protein [Paenibacillus alba]